MRTISNLIVFTMAVYVMLDIYVTAPTIIASSAAPAQYMLASR